MTQSSPHSLPRKVVSRRLEQAIEYVERGWFPASPQILEKIQNRVHNQEYNNNFDLLLNDLKSDFSLFTYLLKGIRSEYPKDKTILEPVAVLRSLNISKILSLISVPIDEISSHTFQEMEKSQAIRLKNTVLGCTTSGLLAEKTQGNVNSDQVFTLSLIRQLGLNLISWNYPSIYGRALQSVKDGVEAEFDEILATQLGFRPIELASALTLPAHAITHYADDLGLKIPEEGEPDVPSITRKLCEIGEAFAILNDTEHYPSGSSQSRASASQIDTILGPNAEPLIFETVKKVYKDYLILSPELNQLIVSTKIAESDKPNPYGKALYSRNPYISKLPEDVKKRIGQVYNTIKKGQVSTEGIQLLATDLMPTIGFHRGCIYLLEQRELTLTPRLRIGTDKVNRYRALSCIDPGFESNPVVHAFSCSYPVRETEIIFLGERVSLVAGALGVSERAGVLYLEMSPLLVSATNYDALAIFKAFRQCLNDCLGLK
jgi:hypothetical protein